METGYLFLASWGGDGLLDPGESRGVGGLVGVRIARRGKGFACLRWEKRWFEVGCMLDYLDCIDELITSSKLSYSCFGIHQVSSDQLNLKVSHTSSLSFTIRVHHEDSLSVCLGLVW